MISGAFSPLLTQALLEGVVVRGRCPEVALRGPRMDSVLEKNTLLALAAASWNQCECDSQ